MRAEMCEACLYDDDTKHMSVVQTGYVRDTGYRWYFWIWLPVVTFLKKSSETQMVKVQRGISHHNSLFIQQYSPFRNN